MTWGQIFILDITILGGHVWTMRDDYANKPHAVRYTTGLVNITIDYDANGNKTSKTVTQGPGKTLNNIIWNEDNKPVTIAVNGVNVTFVYDGNGNRVKKTKGSNTTYYYGDTYGCTIGDALYIFTFNLIHGEFNFKVHHNHVEPDSTPHKASGS